MRLAVFKNDLLNHGNIDVELSLTWWAPSQKLRNQMKTPVTIKLSLTGGCAAGVVPAGRITCPTVCPLDGLGFGGSGIMQQPKQHRKTSPQKMMLVSTTIETAWLNLKMWNFAGTGVAVMVAVMVAVGTESEDGITIAMALVTTAIPVVGRELNVVDPIVLNVFHQLIES
jgi:hypothetical protein